MVLCIKCCVLFFFSLRFVIRSVVSLQKPLRNIHRCSCRLQRGLYKYTTAQYSLSTQNTQYIFAFADNFVLTNLYTYWAKISQSPKNKNKKKRNNKLYRRLRELKRIGHNWQWNNKSLMQYAHTQNTGIWTRQYRQKRQWQWYWELRVNESKRICDNISNRLKAIHTQKYWKTRNNNKQLNNEVDDGWPNMLYSLTVLFLYFYFSAAAIPSMAKSPMSMMTDIFFLYS